MFFLVGVNMAKTDVSGHYSKAIDPCKEIWNKFVNNSESVVTSCKLIESSELTDHIQFGLVKFQYGQKGSLILDGKFSGIEVDFNLNIYKRINC